MRDSAKTIPWNHPNTRCVSIQYKTSLASWCIGVPTTQLALNDFIPDLLLWRWPLFSDASCNGPSYLLAKQKRRFSYVWKIVFNAKIREIKDYFVTSLQILVPCKGYFTKVLLYQGGGLKNLSGVRGFYWGRNVLKIAESGNSKIVNYIVIRRFLTVLWRFSQKKTWFLMLYQSFQK